MNIVITHRPNLNHVAQAVKGIMLTYPYFYTCRMDVLGRLFLHPTTNGLNPDGTVDLADFGELLAEMDYSDIDQLFRQSDLDAANNPNEPMAAFYAGKALKLKLDREHRQIVAQHIEILAVEHCDGERYPADAHLTTHFKANQCLLDRVDVSSMDHEWALAAEEVVTAAITGVANELGMTSPFYRQEHAAPLLLATHAHLSGYLTKLDVVTGTKARLAEMAALSDTLIDEVLAGKGDA